MSRIWKLSLAASGAAAALVCAYLAGLQLTGNFHEVIPGELYRSAQPGPAAIASYAENYGIRTIVNLRGAEKTEWYREERAASDALGLTHIDFKMAASRRVTVEEANRLIAILRDAPKPILIHCRSGADRTGLVSVIYAQQIAGMGEHTAERQLSITYGHIAIPYLSPAFAMDESWERLEKAFGLKS